jgi:hypothetical protein
MNEILADKIHGLFRPVSPASLLGASAGYRQKALVGESEMIITQMGTK